MNYLYGQTMLNSSLIEGLLYQGEGTALDFKRAQYPFSGASEQQQSELLKDVLAFANSWRQTEAYIVIGVEAVTGGKHIPVGTEEHFDDAQIQQFVNYKTNRRIEFSYEVHLCEGRKIGVIRIPQQERPS
jgi:predicted HTH transcriptional regulator